MQSWACSSQLSNCAVTTSPRLRAVVRDSCARSEEARSSGELCQTRCQRRSVSLVRLLRLRPPVLRLHSSVSSSDSACRSRAVQRALPPPWRFIRTACSGLHRGWRTQRSSGGVEVERLRQLTSVKLTAFVFLFPPSQVPSLAPIRLLHQRCSSTPPDSPRRSSTPSLFRHPTASFDAIHYHTREIIGPFSIVFPFAYAFPFVFVFAFAFRIAFSMPFVHLRLHL